MKKDRWIELACGGFVLAFGMVVFFGRNSIAEFFGATILFGVPLDGPSSSKVKLVGWAGAALVVLACAAIVAVIARWHSDEGKPGS